MEFIPQADSSAFQKGAVTSWEYDFPEAPMNLARIEISGRYPAEGYTTNQMVDAIVHVVSGEGSISVKNAATLQLAENDQVYLAPGDAYFFEGTLEVLYAATPKWTPEQTKPIE